MQQSITTTRCNLLQIYFQLTLQYLNSRDFAKPLIHLRSKSYSREELRAQALPIISEAPLR